MKNFRDARYFQITILSFLLVYGVSYLQFNIYLESIIRYIGTCLITQYTFSKYHKLKYDVKSPLISGLSLCLLLRANMPEIEILAAIMAISSKFLLRVNNKHIFNPTNFGIVLTLLATNTILPESAGAWISNGQWGTSTWFAFLMLCLGGLVLYKTTRGDIAVAFLVFYSALIFARAYWLGDTLAIPLHQIQNGGILLFAFFMISDPKTIPNHTIGRIIFAFCVAVLAVLLQAQFYVEDALFFALAVGSISVILLDKLFKGEQYSWHKNITRSYNET